MDRTPDVTDEIRMPARAEVIPGPGRIVVRVAKSRDGMYGTLIMPSTVGDRKYFGRVESVNDSLQLEDDDTPAWIKKGDLVIFGKYAGTEFDVNRDNFIICRESDILAILKDLGPELGWEDVQR